MNNMAKYLSGIMIISMFWLFVGSSAMSRGWREDPSIITVADDGADKKENTRGYLAVPSIMYCTDIKNSEQNLINEGLQILSTGITATSANIGEELIEVWLEPRSKDKNPGRFVVLRIMPKLDMSCILTTGPRMVPGGSYAKDSAE
jgi:hypothetical protein